MNARLLVEAGECVPAALDLSPSHTATIGRSRDSALCVPNDLVSRLHAKVYFDAGRWLVRDFGLNGTRIDGGRVTGAAPLTDGTTIQLGDVRLRFQLVPVGALAQNLPITTQTPPPVGATSLTPGAFRRTPLPNRLATETQGTKVQGYPTREPLNSTEDDGQDGAETQLKVDELTSLCRYMTEAVTTRDPIELIAQTLRVILNQTAASLAGYLSLDPADLTPKVVFPERAAVDMRLSRRLTEQVRVTRKKAWLYGDDTPNLGESLQSLTDAICLPLTGSSGEPFAALHVYRVGRGFTDREVRFLEVAAGFLAPTLEVHRHRRKLVAENSRLRQRGPGRGRTHRRQQCGDAPTDANRPRPRSRSRC